MLVTPITANYSAWEDSEIFYPTEDDEQLAETREHLLAIFFTFSILSQYLTDRAVVFSDQFFYYIKGNPDARIAPDVMVVFGIPLQEYGNYKLWEGGQTPAVVFEMTSKGTKNRDWEFKKNLYEKVGVKEYWLFDPYGDWIPHQLQGYCLNEEGCYQPIGDNCSQVLQLRLQAERYTIGFYRLDTGEKLLNPDEFPVALQLERQQVQVERQQVQVERQRAEEEHQKAIEADLRAEEERQKAKEAELRADRLMQRLRELGVEI